MVSLTCVLFRDHDEARTLTDALGPWLQEGLVAPFLWATQHEVREVEDPKAVWCGGTGAVVSCSRTVAAEPWSVVRVVALQIVSRDSGGDAGLVDAAAELARTLAPRLADNQRLVVLNVLVPDERVRGLPLDLLRWDAHNVVVAPEDRKSPRFAAHPLSAERLHSHALMHLVGLAGLWRHQLKGPLDEEERSAAVNEVPQVMLVQAYGRVVAAPGLAAGTAKAMFHDRASGQWVADAVGGVPAAEPYAIGDAQARTFLQRHDATFSFSEPERTLPELRKVKWWRAFLDMFVFVGRGLRELPYAFGSAAAAYVREEVSTFAQSVTFGADSRVQVAGARQAEDASDEDDVENGARAMADLAAVLLDRAGGAAPTPPGAAPAWQELRAVIFAMADGSTPPTGYDQPTDGHRPQIVVDVFALAPDPLSTLRPDTQVRELLPATAARSTLRAADAVQARHLWSSLTEAHQQATTDSEAPSDPPSAEADENEEEAPPRMDPAVRAKRLADAAALGEELGRLEGWVKERSRSMLWIVADHLAAQFGKADETFVRSLRRVRQGAPNFDGELARQARAALLRNWMLWTVASLVTAYSVSLAMGAPPRLDIDFSGDWRPVGIFGTALLVWLGVMAMCYAMYQRRLFQLWHRRDRENEEYLHAIRCATESAYGIVRLASLNEQLQDWADVIGWMLHHPSAELADEAPPESIEDRITLPASHRFGRGIWSDTRLQRLGAIVGRDLFGRSWLSNLFIAWREDAMRAYAYAHGADVEANLPEPDWDTSPQGPREFLRTTITSGRPAAKWTAQSVEEVERRLRSLPATELVDEVLVSDPDGEAGPTGEMQRKMAAREFLEEVFEGTRHEDPLSVISRGSWETGAQARSHVETGRRIVWSSNELSWPKGKYERGDAGIGSASTGIPEMLVVRVDVVAPAPWTDLTLFAGGDAPPPPPPQPPPPPPPPIAPSSGVIW